MAETKERRKTPRKASSATPKPDTQKNSPEGAGLRAQQPPGELRKQIEEAAYYRAKQRGFVPGHELEDWVQAESEVLGNAGR